VILSGLILCVPAWLQLARKEESIRALESAREQLRSAQSERSAQTASRPPSVKEAQVGCMAWLT
jgi:hypothetical protein